MKTARKRVLIADCHEEVLIVLEHMLEDAGFDTTTAWTASDALRMLASPGFDLVLLNEYLPDAECEDVLTALRKKGPQVPCIVMQPSALEMDKMKDLRILGAREIVCKYAYQQVVETVIRYLCGRAAGTAEGGEKKLVGSL